MTGKIIAFSGHDGVGKTETAGMLCYHLDGIILSLATPLKAAAAEHLGMSIEEIRTKPTPDHLRAYLRAYGWAMRVEQGNDYWVKRWHTQAKILLDQGYDVICEDLRHRNEYEFFDSIGAHVVALARSRAEPQYKREQDDGTFELIKYPPIISEVWEVRDRVIASDKHTFIATDMLTAEEAARLVFAELTKSNLEAV